MLSLSASVIDDISVSNGILSINNDDIKEELQLSDLSGVSEIREDKEKHIFYVVLSFRMKTFRAMKVVFIHGAEKDVKNFVNQIENK